MKVLFRKERSVSLHKWEVRIQWVAVFSPRSRERTKGKEIVRQNKDIEENATISSLLPPRTVP